MSESESIFERDLPEPESAAEESEAVGRFKDTFNSTDTNPGYSDGFGELAADDVPDRDDTPAEPVDDTPDSDVYSALGVDRAELAEWGHQVGIDNVLSAPKTSADLARNVRAAAALKAGHEARQELSERDSDDAVSTALERLEEADEFAEQYAAANDLLAEAPDRVAEFVEQWYEYDPEAASGWASAVAAREREASAQLESLRWTQSVIAAEATRRQAEADSAADTERAISEVVRENPVAARVSPETLEELAAQMPPEDTSPAGLRAWQADLLRSAAELERSLATMRFKQGILEGEGEFEHSAHGMRHVGIASADVNPQRLLRRETVQETHDAIRAGVLHDENHEYSELMDNLRKSDLGLKEHYAKQDALRRARGRGG